jgi:hypothetical protein
MNALAPALPLLKVGGAGDSSVLPVYLIPGNTTSSQPGRHSGRAEPLERQRFWSLNRNNILTIFSLVIFRYELVAKMALYLFLKKPAKCREKINWG